MTRSIDSLNSTVKFLYSYGGKVLPRRSDGGLRYVGGFTRVLAVHRSITYAELMVKFGKLRGYSMNLKVKLPNEDLGLLITIQCDEELASVIEEYDRVSVSSNKEMKIRLLLFPHKSLKLISSPSSPPFTAASSYFDYSPPVYPLRAATVPVYHPTGRFSSNLPIYPSYNVPAVGITVGVEDRRQQPGSGALFAVGISGYTNNYNSGKPCRRA